MKLRRVLGLVAGCGAAVMNCAAEPPKLVKTEPAIGALDVDPALTTISVTFDRDMRNGMSWTGGGPVFPARPEGTRPAWRDQRTCELPVKLEPGRFYRVGINSTSFRNFRSSDGESVPPRDFYFVTAGASAEEREKAVPPRPVSFDPPNGAQNVDSMTTAIQVTFDRKMGPGFSWTGGGPNYPEMAGKPSWDESGSTCRMPVTLRPDQEYRIGINSLSHRNFQSESGVAAEPVVYTFRTAP